jgi:hypothetical protein
MPADAMLHCERQDINRENEDEVKMEQLRWARQRVDAVCSNPACTSGRTDDFKGCPCKHVISHIIYSSAKEKWCTLYCIHHAHLCLARTTASYFLAGLMILLLFQVGRLLSKKLPSCFSHKMIFPQKKKKKTNTRDS